MEDTFILLQLSKQEGRNFPKQTIIQKECWLMWKYKYGMNYDGQDIDIAIHARKKEIQVKLEMGESGKQSDVSATMEVPPK